MNGRSPAGPASASERDGDWVWGRSPHSLNSDLPGLAALREGGSVLRVRPDHTDWKGQNPRCLMRPAAH